MTAVQKAVRAAVVFSLFCGALHARATVIIDDAAVSPFAPAPRQILRLTQSIPQGQGEFAIFLDPLNSSQVRFTYAGIAEVYALYATSVGTAFDPAFALSTVPLVTNSPTGPATNVELFNVGQSAFFAYWDDRNFNASPDSNDNYGWVQLTRTASGLVATSSATAIGSGIIVGTVSQIPEPASAALIALAAAFMLCRHRISRRERDTI
jgi:hypothetical protein